MLNNQTYFLLYYWCYNNTTASRVACRLGKQRKLAGSRNCSTSCWHSNGVTLGSGLQRLCSMTRAYYSTMEHRNSCAYAFQVSPGPTASRLGHLSTVNAWCLGQTHLAATHLGHVSVAVSVPCSGTVMHRTLDRWKQRSLDMVHGLEFGDCCPTV